MVDCWKCRRLWKKFCRGSKLEAQSKLVSGCVKGPHCGEAEVSSCAEEERCVKLKMRPLGKIRSSSASTLTALTACNDDILRNLAPFGQDLQLLCQIWCLQCIVMADWVVGFYKETPRLANFALRIFLSFIVQSMSADREA